MSRLTAAAGDQLEESTGTKTSADTKFTLYAVVHVSIDLWYELVLNLVHLCYNSTKFSNALLKINSTGTLRPAGGGKVVLGAGRAVTAR